MSDLTLRFQRSDAMRRPLLDDLRLGPGTLRDYAALAAHHYCAARPATATRVLVFRHAAPSVVGRWLGRRGETQTVAVLVESLPALSCALRDHALRGRYVGLTPRERGRAITAEIRCISRVVVDPRWRGLGLAVRLVRAALDEPATPITEALAAMGAIHPFFAHAGMTRYDRPPHPHDARLLDAFEHAGLRARELVSLRRTLARIAALDDDRRAWFTRELRHWHARAARARAETPLDEALVFARRRLLCRPVYFARLHPSPRTPIRQEIPDEPA